MRGGEVEQTGIEDISQRHIGMRGFDHAGIGIESADDGAGSRQLVWRRDIGLVENDHVSKLDLIDEHCTSGRRPSSPATSPDPSESRRMHNP